VYDPRFLTVGKTVFCNGIKGIVSDWWWKTVIDDSGVYTMPVISIKDSAEQVIGTSELKETEEDKKRSRLSKFQRWNKERKYSREVNIYEFKCIDCGREIGDHNNKMIPHTGQSHRMEREIEIYERGCEDPPKL